MSTGNEGTVNFSSEISNLHEAMNERQARVKEIECELSDILAANRADAALIAELADHVQDACTRIVNVQVNDTPRPEATKQVPSRQI